MLYAGKAGSAKEEARDVLREHWENTDWNHWDDRLKGGDVTAWREMLVASFLAEIDPTMSLPKRNIFEQLKSKESFAASDLRFLPMSREEMRCEAYFYDSLLAEALRNEARDKKNTSDAKSYDDRSKQDLRAAVGTNVKQYIEYSLAKFKLTQEANK
jgi:hypothetical protein